MIKKSLYLLFFVFILLIIPNTAFAITINDIQYRTNDNGTATVESAKMNEKKEIIIPDSIEVEGVTYSVTETAYRMDIIQDRMEVEYVKLSSGFTKITGDVGYGGLFAYLPNLIKVDMPDTMIEIGHESFIECTSLKEVILPSSLTTLGENVFKNCSNLQSIVIPNGVSEIPNGTFYNCSALKAITLPENLTSISDNAFYRTYINRINLSNVSQMKFIKSITGMPLKSLSITIDGVKIGVLESNDDYVYFSRRIDEKTSVYTKYSFTDDTEISFEVKDGEDGITPKIQINKTTGELEVSYDKGKTWTSLGKVVGKDGINGTNGKDGITPQLKINTNGGLEVSYDEGKTWTSLGKVVGKDGVDGIDGKDGKNGESNSLTTQINEVAGKDGITPKIQINKTTGELEVSYDEGKTWTSLGKVVGKDGITPKIRINTETNELEVSYDEGESWGTLGVSISENVIVQANTKVEYGMREYIIISVLGGLALLGNLGWIIKRKK